MDIDLFLFLTNNVTNIGGGGKGRNIGGQVDAFHLHAWREISDNGTADRSRSEP